MFIKKFISVAAVVAISTCILSSCEQSEPVATPTPKPVTATATKAPSKELAELINVTLPIHIRVSINGVSKVMMGEIYPDLAPETVANFKKLCDEGFYEGLIFHRVIPGFMIQGGGYNTDMQEKETASIKGEFDSNGFENPLKHTKGVLSMARTQIPDSASSQFFIMHADSPHLDGEYAAFGRITEGLEVIDEIAESATTSLPNGMDDVPVDDVVIEDIVVYMNN